VHRTGVPMLNDKREAHYLWTRRKRKLNLKLVKNRAKDPDYVSKRSELTPAQERRVRHREESRKSHEHDRSAVPEGEKFRCPRCMPLPHAQPAIKAAEGPRDWSPSGADLH
jgi:hypothetical protein